MVPNRKPPEVKLPGDALPASLLNVVRHPGALLISLVVSLFPSYFIQKLFGDWSANAYEPAALAARVAVVVVGGSIPTMLVAVYIAWRTYQIEAVTAVGAPDVARTRTGAAIAAVLLADLFLVPVCVVAVLLKSPSTPYWAIPAAALIGFCFFLAPAVVAMETLSPWESLVRSARVAFSNLLVSFVYYCVIVVAAVVLTIVLLSGYNAGQNIGFVVGVLAITFLVAVPGAVASVPFARGYLDAASVAPVPARPAAPKPGRYVGYGKTESSGAAQAATPSTASDLFTKGMGFITLDKPEEAVKLLQQAAEMNPDLSRGQKYFTACLSLADAFARKGDKERAIHFYSMYVDLAPRGPKRDAVQRKINEMAPLATAERPDATAGPADATAGPADATRKEP